MANIKEEDVHSVIYYDWVKKHKLDNIGVNLIEKLYEKLYGR